MGITWQEKRKVLELSKFTIAGDSIHYPGFVTEKIIQPFEHHSIPIYFGSTTMDKDLNPEAFVWCKDEKDVVDTVERIMNLDSDDEAYLKMLMAYPLAEKDMLKKKYIELEAFLVHIFEQTPQDARRRINYFCAAEHTQLLRYCMNEMDKTSLVDRLHAYKKIASKRLRGKK